MIHIITALVNNKPGVLARIIGLISGRGYNIESLDVAPTPQDHGVSRLIMSVPGDDRILDQVTKHLEKLVDVLEVTHITDKMTEQDKAAAKPEKKGRT
ncbi:MAG: acetolactate synthase small subunit [Verrucomicrobiota bacterium]|nr:acetolactate synthase small subunit [Verrucomicrobiota bacterium]